MLLLTSVVSLVLAAGGLAFAGPSLPAEIAEGLVVFGAFSAFAAICSAEAALAS